MRATAAGPVLLLSSTTLEEGRAALRRSDPRLGAWIDRIGPVSLRRHRHRFGALCRAILSQQLATAAAATIHARFLAHFAPARFPDPARLLSLPDDALRTCGISAPKLRYLRALADEWQNGPLGRAKLGSLADGEVIELLTRVSGIGVWTAEMFLIFSLGRLDVFSAGDLALRTGLGRVEGRAELRPKESAALAARWSPYRSVASLYLWRIAHWDGALPAPVRARR
jgi:DNA-3-methyladenine glycosylase II